MALATIIKPRKRSVQNLHISAGQSVGDWYSILRASTKNKRLTRRFNNLSDILLD